MEKKFRLTSINTYVIGHTLYRIEALKDFGDVKKGDLGGFVEVEENLSQQGTSWIYDNAKVIGKAKVYDNAKVCNNAQIYDCAEIYGNAEIHDTAVVGNNAAICGNAIICDSAIVCGETIIYDNAKVFNQAYVGGDILIIDKVKIGGVAHLHGYMKIIGDTVIMSDKDFIVFKNFWSSGRYFTWTRSNNMWTVGCFYGTGEELIKKAYEDSEESGREYERVVKYTESILADEEKQKKDNQNTLENHYTWKTIKFTKPISFEFNTTNLEKAFLKFKQTKDKIDITFKYRPDNTVKKYWKNIKGWIKQNTENLLK